MTEICYRCKGPLIDVTPSDVTEVRFFSCHLCESQYAKSEEGQLHDRWGMPLTLPLYSLIFAKSANDRLEEIRDQVLAKGRPFVERLISNIDDELAAPKQRLIDLHRFEYLDEVQLREFLGKLRDLLQPLRH